MIARKLRNQAGPSWAELLATWAIVITRRFSDPEIIVADEPTGDLDAKNAEGTLELLRMLKQEFGKTVVMVTHDPRAEKYVDEVHHLDKGVLLETRAGGAAAVGGAS